MENILRAFEKSRAEGKPGAVDRTPSTEPAAGPVVADPDAHDAEPQEAHDTDLRDTPIPATMRLEADNAAARASSRTIDEALTRIAEADAAPRETWGDARPLAEGQEEGNGSQVVAGAERSDALRSDRSVSEPKDLADDNDEIGGGIAIPVGPQRQAAAVPERRPIALRSAVIAVSVLVVLAAAGVFLVQTDPQVAVAWDEFQSAFQQRASLLGEWADRFLDMD